MLYFVLIFAIACCVVVTFSVYIHENFTYVLKHLKDRRYPGVVVVPVVCVHARGRGRD